MNRRPVSIQHPGLQQLERVARLLDSQFTIPGTSVKFGLDPIIGLIPYLGELSTFFVSAMLATTMAKYGGSRKLALMMVGNIMIDALIGAIPFLGRFFDFYFKANDRNVRLLADHYRFGSHSGSGKGMILMVVLFTVITLFLLLWLLTKALTFLGNLFF